MSPATPAPTSTRHPSNSVSKRKAARIAKEEEERLIASANTRRFLVQRGWAPPSSDLSKFSRRSDPLVDRAALEFLDKKLASGGHFGLTTSPARLVRLRPTSELNKLKRWGAKYTLSRKARHILTRVHSPTGLGTAYLIHVPIWDHASDVWKTLALVTSIPVGQRLAFNLNLAPDIALRAIKSKKGPAKYLQDRLATELRLAFPGRPQPAFFMQLEMLDASRRCPDTYGLHLHGVIERPSSDADVGRMKEALRRAAGKTVAAKRARLLLLRSALNPLGWAAYIYKHRLATSAAIRDCRLLLACPPVPGADTVLAASARLRAQAQAWYNAQREDEDLIWVSRKKTISRVTL